MTLIVEDGTGLPNAESYVSVADATAYHAARGNAAWATIASDELREQVLRKATDYMAQSYGRRWQGERVHSAQALDWPRIGVVANCFTVASDIVPVAVANACAELALRASAGALAPDVGRLKQRTKVGPIEVEYVAGAPAGTKYRAVDGMISAFMGAGGSFNIGLVRA